MPRSTTLTVLLSVIALALAPTAASAGGSSADSPSGSPSLLFVQDAERGTLVPISGRPGQYRLTLHGVASRTLWFQNRPGTFKGTIANGRMLRLFFDRNVTDPAPNGAIDAWDPRRGEDVTMGVKFLSGGWDARTRTLRYRVARLRQAPTPRGGKHRRQPRTRVDGVLPRRFGEAAIFIDDAQCMGECQLVLDIYKLGVIASDFFTSRNTCAAGVANDTRAPLRWTGDDSKREDSWQTNPPRTIAPMAPHREPVFAGWMTVSGWLRGCWNTVYYQNEYGTVEIGVADPYSGSNDWLCRATGRLRCLGPEHRVRHYLWQYNGRWVSSYMDVASRLGGTHLSVAYCIVRTDVPLSSSMCDDDPYRDE